MKKNRRKINKMKRMLTLVAAMALVLCIGIGATYAWLTDKTDPITNTFTTGNVSIELEEPNFDQNEEHVIIPGHVCAKDPTVTVLEGSQPCYVFIGVKNELVIGENVVGTYEVNEGWTQIAEENGIIVYMYDDAVSAGTEVPALFDAILYSGELITEANIETLNNKSITVQAYAHQANGEGMTIETAKAAAIAALAPTP